MGELWEEISTDLTKICLATEVLSEQFCIEIDQLSSAPWKRDEMEETHRR